MRLTKKYLRKLVLEEFRVLLEEEGEEEATEEEGAEEEPAEGEEGGEEEEAEEEIKLDAEEEATLSKSADDQILAHIIDFETNAIKSATLVKDDELRPDPDGTPIEIETESKWYKRSLSNMLFEEEAAREGMNPDWVGSPDIDVAVFATDVARLVMNYDSLIDMEAMIIEKSKNYLTDKYDQETADYFIELMDVEHDMRSHDTPAIDSENETPASPPAIGSGFASQPGGGGA